MTIHCLSLATRIYLMYFKLHTTRLSDESDKCYQEEIFNFAPKTLVHKKRYYRCIKADVQVSWLFLDLHTCWEKNHSTAHNGQQ